MPMVVCPSTLTQALLVPALSTTSRDAVASIGAKLPFTPRMTPTLLVPTPGPNATVPSMRRRTPAEPVIVGWVALGSRMRSPPTSWEPSRPSLPLVLKPAVTDAPRLSIRPPATTDTRAVARTSRAIGTG